MTFGSESIDDASAPISSSPASAPAAEGVKSFVSVAFQSDDSDAAKSVVTRPTQLSSASSTSSSQAAAAPSSTPPSVPKFDKKSIAKLFLGPSTQSVSAPPLEAAYLAPRSAPLPSQAPSQGQPYSPTFSPDALCQGENGDPSAHLSFFSRTMANSQNSGVGVSGQLQAGSGGPSAGPALTGLSSPRITPHPPPGPPSGLLPSPAMWPGYYVRALSLPFPDDVSTLTYPCYVVVSPFIRPTSREILSTTMARSPPGSMLSCSVCICVHDLTPSCYLSTARKYVVPLHVQLHPLYDVMFSRTVTLSTRTHRDPSSAPSLARISSTSKSSHNLSGL